MLVDELIALPAATVSVHEASQVSAGWSDERIEQFSMSVAIDIDRGPMPTRQIVGVGVDNHCQWKRRQFNGGGGGGSGFLKASTTIMMARLFVVGGGGSDRWRRLQWRWETIVRIDTDKCLAHSLIVRTPGNGKLQLFRR